jgi:regulatory protein SWI5
MHSIGMQRGHSLQGIFEHSVADIPSPPKTAPITSCTFDMAVMPSSSLADDGGPVKTAFFSSPHRSPAKSPNMSSFNSSPLVTAATIFEDPGLEQMSSQTSLPSSQIQLLLSASASPVKGPSSPKGSMSITDLNLTPEVDATKVDTGITMDDIETYMEGPEPADNKFVCRFPDCNKRFGRRENIKSHIQTHLNDRQYQCLHCGSKFVRGHDLKRHAKTHEGKKPFVCLCGNGFGRPDALTRHRQRNMCIGAIDGIVKKEVRRGRPPKYSSALEARKEKVRRTKERNRANAAAHAHTSSQASLTAFPSSVSVSSDSEYHSSSPPPSTLFDNLSLIDPSSPADDLDVIIRDSSPYMSDHGMLMSGGDSFGFPPGVFTFTPPTSPGYSTGNKPSPHRSHSNSLTSLGLGRSDSFNSKPNRNPGSPIDKSIRNAPRAGFEQAVMNTNASYMANPFVNSPKASPLLHSSSPPGLQGLSEASSPMTDEEMDAFLDSIEPLQGTIEDVTGSAANGLYSNEFFNGDGEFTL